MRTIAHTVVTRALLLLVFMGSAVSHLTAEQQGLGIRFGLGYQDTGGLFGQVAHGGIDGEFSLMYVERGVRLGLGTNWVSFGAEDIDDESWSQVTGHALLGYGRALGQSTRPYVELRRTHRRIRPEGRRFFDEEAARSHLSGSWATGKGWGVVAGLELLIGRRSALDLSGGLGEFTTKANQTSQDLAAARSGSTWWVHSGITWFLFR